MYWMSHVLGVFGCEDVFDAHALGCLGVKIMSMSLGVKIMSMSLGVKIMSMSLGVKIAAVHLRLDVNMSLMVRSPGPLV